MIEDAKLACVARDKAKSELATIKQQAEKGKFDFEVRIHFLGEDKGSILSNHIRVEEGSKVDGRTRECLPFGWHLGHTHFCCSHAML